MRVRYGAHSHPTRHASSEGDHVEIAGQSEGGGVFCVMGGVVYKMQMMQRFIGGGLQAPSIDSLQHSGVKVSTVAMGNLYADIMLIMRNFDKFGVDV